jgi:hypothetical protein
MIFQEFSFPILSELHVLKCMKMFCEIIGLGVKRLKIDFIKNLTPLCKHLKFDIVED